VLHLAQQFADAVQRDLGGEGRRLLDPELVAELGVRPLPPLVLQGGQVGEVVAAGEHVARVDRLPEVDDGVVPLAARGSGSTEQRARRTVHQEAPLALPAAEGPEEHQRGHPLDGPLAPSNQPHVLRAAPGAVNHLSRLHLVSTR